MDLTIGEVAEEAGVTASDLLTLTTSQLADIDRRLSDRAGVDPTAHPPRLPRCTPATE